MTVAIVTCITDGYDPLKDIVLQDVEVEAICVTDDLNLTSESWNVVYEARGDVHPNLAAKRPKMRPWDYTDAEWTVWVDGSFRVNSHSFAQEMMKYGPVGQFLHPDRTCIYDEAAYSASLNKYADLPLVRQSDYYRQMGHPEFWGLWATGLIVRQHTPEVVAFGEAWFSECARWGYQDQVSEAPTLRQFGLRPETIPGGYGGNPWIMWEGSARH